MCPVCWMTILGASLGFVMVAGALVLRDWVSWLIVAFGVLGTVAEVRWGFSGWWFWLAWGLLAVRVVYIVVPRASDVWRSAKGASKPLVQSVWQRFVQFRRGA